MSTTKLNMKILINPAIFINLQHLALSVLKIFVLIQNYMMISFDLHNSSLYQHLVQASFGHNLSPSHQHLYEDQHPVQALQHAPHHLRLPVHMPGHTLGHLLMLSEKRPCHCLMQWCWRGVQSLRVLRKGLCYWVVWWGGLIL